MGLNPMSVTLVRADGLPGHYSGTPFKRPFVELAECCAAVYVTWSLLGASHTSEARAHGTTLRWNERRMLLAGSRVIDPADLHRQLREVGLKMELHDRDPLPMAPAPAPAPVDVADGEGDAEVGRRDLAYLARAERAEAEVTN